MKTIFTLFFASSIVITINLTSSWLGGFGFQAWLVLVAAGLFIWGVARAMSDYKRLFRN